MGFGCVFLGIFPPQTFLIFGLARRSPVRTPNLAKREGLSGCWSCPGLIWSKRGGRDYAVGRERWIKAMSMRTRAVMVSTMGTARLTTKGSWRPLVASTVSCPSKSAVFWALLMVAGGLMATRKWMASPLLMPPWMPPVLCAESASKPWDRTHYKEQRGVSALVTKPSAQHQQQPADTNQHHT